MRNRNRLLPALLATVLLGQVALLPVPAHAADLGITWTRVSPYPWPADILGASELDPPTEVRGTLADVAVVDTRTVWAVGQRIVMPSTAAAWVAHTADGGSTWTSATVGAYTGSLRGVDAITDTQVWTVGDAGLILKWNGSTWTQQGAGVTTKALYDVAFYDAANGWAVGADRTILRTTNGGTSWTVSGSAVAGATLFGVSALDATHVWAVGSSGLAMYWDGSAWTAATAITANNLRSVSFPDATHGWATGENNTFTATTDGGRTWSAQTAPLPPGLDPFYAVPYSVAFSDYRNGVAVGDYQLCWRTTDGGETWQTVQIPENPSLPLADLRAVGMAPNAASANPSTIFAAGATASGFSVKAYVFRGLWTFDSTPSAPSASNDATSVAEDTTLTIVAPGFLRNDTDPDGDALQIAEWTPAGHGSILLWADGHGTYRPELDWNGTDTFRYKCKDTHDVESEWATVTINVTRVNDVPIAVPHSYNVTEDLQLSMPAPGLLAGCTAVDTATPRAYKVASPSHGTATVAVDGSFTYTPNANYNGPDTFTYRVFDGGDYSVAATVTLTVAAVPDAPVAVNDTYPTPMDTTLTVPTLGVLANDTDADGDGITSALVSDATSGSLTLGTDGGFTYVPDTGFVGTDRFSYVASDGVLASNVATVTITVTDPNAVKTVSRVSGSDRYAVASTMASRGWNTDTRWGETTHVVVACGEAGKEPDPLAAAGLAGIYDCPILLTKTASLPNTTRNAIASMAAAHHGLRVHIVGGTASVPDARWNQIRAIPWVSQTKDRIAGSDRYAVTANIATRMVSVVGTSGVQGVLVICSEKPAAFYDALAASPIAYAQHMPMLGVKTTSVPSSVLNRLNTVLSGETCYVVSSSAYISAATYSAVGGDERLATSSNMYTAATQIANKAIGPTHAWLAATDTGVAAKLPDALGGGAFMGNAGGVMLYTTSTSGMQSTTRTWITNRHNDITRGWVFGGTASFPGAQETLFRGLLEL